MTNEAEAVGYRIKMIRKSKKLTQEDVAEKVGIDAKSLGRIENGMYFPSIPTLGKLAHALAVSVREFFPESTAAPISIPEPPTLREVRRDLVEFIYTEPADALTLMRWHREAIRKA
jgi:transcriptional regulator with XRE-family HTH domain